ncbi:methyltransferase domain-containing protein, partial [archaeon]
MGEEESPSQIHGDIPNASAHIQAHRLLEQAGERTVKRKLFLLLSNDEKHLVEQKDINTKSGIIKASQLKMGKIIKTHIGKKFAVAKPTLNDIIHMGVKRTAQVILPKDISLVLAYTGVLNDSLVVDAGTGTGYTAIFIANYVSNGKVVTYEKDKRFSKVAEKNIEFSGMPNIKLRLSDVTKGIKEKNVDLVMLDMQDAHKAVNHAYNSLKIGGYLVIYSPTIEHLTRSLNAVRKKSFSDVKTVENIVREWQTERTTRPK